MKKETMLFSVFLLAGAVLFGIFGMSVIREAYRHEIHTVQNLAGRMLIEYPETENAFLEALADMDRTDSGAGSVFLERYGYDEQKKIEENRRYQHTLQFFCRYLAVFVIAALAGGYCFDRLSVWKKKRQEEQILSVLEGCLSGDFQFLDDEEALKRLGNRQFADTLEKFGRKLQLKSEFLEAEHDDTKSLVTDISHQLRTPLGALRVCFLLYGEAQDEAEKGEFGERCEMQMDKLETLTEALGSISRLETHMIRLQPEKVSITELLAGAVNTVYHKALAKQIAIEVDELEEISLFLDKKWTTEAISNVLDNAVKYSSVGSCIFVRVWKLFNFVRVEIEDQGIGIPKREWNQIFRRFYRGDSDFVKKEDGIGVGLYLARKIIEEGGGTISVRQAKEKGSIFVIQLPLPQTGNLSDGQKKEGFL